MNDHDQELIDNGLNRKLTPYEKVLEEKARRERWRQYRKEIIERKFDWFLKREMGEFYNYDPRED